MDNRFDHMTVKTVEIEQLSVTYEERGRIYSPVILLLHGWPDDVRTWDAVADQLASAGFRTIAPYLRGFGPTRFRDSATPRTAQMVAMARDAVQFLDALGLHQVILVGHDWGARIGYIAAALWPQRIERLVAISVPYQTGIRSGSLLDYQQAHAFWYQWFFASERGHEALQGNARGLCRYLWRTWAPTWKFSDAEFETTAASWTNPDWVQVTLHAYRVRWGHAAPDPRFAELEARMEKHPPISVPTVVIHGAADGCVLPVSFPGIEPAFVGGYRHEVLADVGHFPQRERPQAIVDAILG